MNAEDETAERELRPLQIHPLQRSARSGRARLAWLGEVALILAIAAVLVQWRMRSGAGASGLVRVADDEVAVVTDLWSGEQRSVLTPGYEMIVPRLESVHKLDKSPVQYVMEGDKRKGPNRVPRLSVRARDGSLFWFERVSIQYGLDVRRLATVIQDSGPGEGFRSGIVDAFAPSVLHDELGRFDPKEVVSPDNLQAATARAKERLNVALAPHGIEVYEVAVSKPSFDERYEDVLERREVALQEMQSLRQQAELMEKAQAALLAELSKKAEIELEKADAKWAQELTELQQEAARLRLGRPQELAQLEQHKRLALEKAQVDWQADLSGLEEAARELERAREQHMAKLEREHGLALDRARVQQGDELAALRREAEGMQVAHEGRIAALRREMELERGRSRAELAAKMDAAHTAALRSDFEARSYREARLASAQVEREGLRVQAAALEARYRGEHEAFLARAEAFEAHGPAAVRAALIGRLSSILFEIAPFAPPAAAEASSPRKAAARVASGSEKGAR